MARKTLLNFIRRSPLHSYLVGFLATFVVGSAVALIVLYPVRMIYYGIVTGDYLLNVESVTAEKEVEQGDELSIAFCRSPRVRIIAVNNIRTFYLSENNQPVYQRNLPDGVAYEFTTDPCQPLTIKSNQRPDEIGTYKFCQEFDFDTYYGQKKTARFCSTDYQVIAPKAD